MIVRIVKDYKYEGSGPTWSVGSIVEMDDEDAEKLISGGFAEEAELVEVSETNVEADEEETPQEKMEGLEEDPAKMYPKGGSPVPEKVAPSVMLSAPDGSGGPVVVDDGNLTLDDHGKAVLGNELAYESAEPVDGADLAAADDNDDNA